MICPPRLSRPLSLAKLMSAPNRFWRARKVALSRLALPCCSLERREGPSPPRRGGRSAAPEGVVVAAGRERQHGADAGEGQVPLGVLRLGVAEVAGQAAHAGQLAVLPGRIGELHRDPLIRQRLADGPGHRVGADEQPDIGGALAHVEQSGQWRGRQALQHHGEDDDRKHQGHQLVGILDAGLVHADGEGGADRRRHYAPGAIQASRARARQGRSDPGSRPGCRAGGPRTAPRTAGPAPWGRAARAGPDRGGPPAG